MGCRFGCYQTPLCNGKAITDTVIQWLFGLNLWFFCPKKQVQKVLALVHADGIWAEKHRIATNECIILHLCNLRQIRPDLSAYKQCLASPFAKRVRFVLLVRPKYGLHRLSTVLFRSVVNPNIPNASR